MGWREGGEGTEGSMDESWEEGEGGGGEGGRPLVRFSWEVGLTEEEKEEKKSKVNDNFKK